MSALQMLNQLIGCIENIFDGSEEEKSESTLNVMTWNIAGINNNPWEYYVTVNDKNYNILMENVETFLTNDGKNIKVRDVLNEIDKDFFGKLKKLIADKETLLNEKDNTFESILANDINKYLNIAICDFLSNKFIGENRLISWPDRLLNTIDDKKENYIYRPTPINYYSKTFKNSTHWFDLWLEFMNNIGIDILTQHKDNKYAQKYIKLGNNQIFLTLNIILLSIFDAILIYLLFDIERKTKIAWQRVKFQLYNILNKNKLNNTIGILNDMYCNCDILFIQEARNNFTELIDNKNIFKQNYHIIFPTKVSKNNQTSIICLRKKMFNLNEIEEITAIFYEHYSGKMGINLGDLIVIKIENLKYILISFHGDTGGLATADLLKVINNIMQNKYNNYKLIIGIDCNTYYQQTVTAKKKKYSVNACNTLIQELNMKHCFNGNEIPTKHTTNCPRTYLQPQLNKAVKKADIKMNKYVDFRSPKDFIIFYKNQFEVMENSTVIDNTGEKGYNDSVEYILPSQYFPSDHAILSTSLTNIKTK